MGEPVIPSTYDQFELVDFEGQVKLVLGQINDISPFSTNSVAFENQETARRSDASQSENVLDTIDIEDRICSSSSALKPLATESTTQA